MNKVIEIGRLTKDPEIRYSQGANTTCIARYTLAVDRKFKQEGQPTPSNDNSWMSIPDNLDDSSLPFN